MRYQDFPSQPKLTLRRVMTFLCIYGLSVTLAHAATDFETLRKDCENNDNSVSCAKAGVHLEKQGKKAEAARLYQKACTLFVRPIGMACYLWGTLTADKAQAQKAYLRACELGDADGCTATGEVYTQQGQTAQALTYYKKGCTANDGKGCHRVARVLMKQQKTQQALQFLRRSCALEYPAGCGYLGWIYEEKQKNQAKAKKAYAYGCRLKGAPECARLGLLLYKMKQPQEALTYLRRSCRFGYNKGCTLARTLNLQIRGPRR